MFCLYFFFFNDCVQTSCLNICRTDLREVCRVGRTVAVDERSVVSSSIPRGMLPGQPIFVGFLHLYPHNSVLMRAVLWWRMTGSASAVLDAGKPIN